MIDLRIKEGAFWFYWALVITGAMTCVTYRNDPVSLSAGAAATLIGVAMLLLPPLLRGGWLLWRVAAMISTLIFLVTTIAAILKGKNPHMAAGFAITALFLLFSHILTNPILWDKLKRYRALNKETPTQSAKGYLDHQLDIEKARKTINRTLKEISKITADETKGIEKETARAPKISKLSSAKQLASSRRSARFADRATQKLASKVQILAQATKTMASAELASWEWRSRRLNIEPANVLELLEAKKRKMDTVQRHLEALKGRRKAIEGRRGISQAINDAIDRRLYVEDQMIQAVASEQSPLQQVIELLEPLTKGPVGQTLSGPTARVSSAQPNGMG
jgi:hypothetical protein